MPLDEWRRVLEVNLTGTFLVTQTCLPALIAAGWGRVIMITSQAARTRTVPGAHYSATKSGMTGLAGCWPARWPNTGSRSIAWRRAASSRP